MIGETLKKMVDASYFNNEFEYGIGKIQKKTVEDIEGVRKYHGHLHRGDVHQYLFKSYLFVRIQGSKEWRIATNPDEIGGHLRTLLFTNPLVYLLTTVKRVAEAVFLVLNCFFEMFAEIYQQKATANLTKVFIACLSEFHELWNAVKNDCYCAGVMELAAIHGAWNCEDATRMQFLFGDTERQWNRYKEDGTFKHIEVYETPLFGAFLLLSKCYKTNIPLIWIYMVKESAQHDTSVLESIIEESTGEKLNSPIDYLDTAIDSMETARVSVEDLILLKEIIEKVPEFKSMNIRDLISSTRLKCRFLMRQVQRIWKTHRRGLVIQDPDAYPFSCEKQKRVEVMKNTISNDIKIAWEKFAPAPTPLQRYYKPEFGV